MSDKNSLKAMDAKAKGLAKEVNGIAPLDLESCSRDAIPKDWEIDSVMGDILMCRYVDENESGEVMRDGVWVPLNMVQHLWRVVEVMKVGPQASENMNEGDFLMIPSSRGIPGVSKGGDKLIFINEPRVFAKVVKSA